VGTKDTPFANPIDTNTTPGHYNFTYYYFLGTYSVHVYWTTNNGTERRHDVAQTHTSFGVGKQREKGNVEYHSLLRQKEQFYCFQIHK
jgi:hypothetical protein